MLCVTSEHFTKNHSCQCNVFTYMYVEMHVACGGRNPLMVRESPCSWGNPLLQVPTAGMDVRCTPMKAVRAIPQNLIRQFILSHFYVHTISRTVHIMALKLPNWPHFLPTLSSSFSPPCRRVPSPGHHRHPLYQTPRIRSDGYLYS